MFLGVLFLGFSVISVLKEEQIVTQAREERTNENMTESVPTFPVQIKIADKIDAPVEAFAKKNDFWVLSPTHVVFWSESSLPGTPGNTVFYGHNNKKLLGKLHEVNVGETISVTTANETVFEYTITKKVTTSPDKLEYIAPTESELLTIYTCTGFLDTKRLIIQAERI